MARTSSSKKQRKRRNYGTGIALLTISLAVVVGVTVIYKHLQESRVQVDPQTLCPIDGPVEIVAILVDSTDPFSGVQKDYLVKFFDEVEAKLGKGTLVQLFSAASYSEISLNPETDICNPGDGSDVSEWSGNPEKVREQWLTSFKEPLNTALKSSIEASASETSPLLAMIKAVSYKAFPATASLIPRKLYIVSDMLEHTDAFSQYTSSLGFEEVSQLPFYAHVSPNLGGVEVYVIYISRPGFEQRQTRRHAEFWSSYFEQVGASLQSIKRI